MTWAEFADEDTKEAVVGGMAMGVEVMEEAMRRDQTGKHLPHKWTDASYCTSRHSTRRHIEGLPMQGKGQRTSEVMIRLGWVAQSTHPNNPPPREHHLAPGHATLQMRPRRAQRH